MRLAHQLVRAKRAGAHRLLLLDGGCDDLGLDSRIRHRSVPLLALGRSILLTWVLGSILLGLLVHIF